MKDKTSGQEDWSLILKPKANWFSFSWQEIWHYRDLLMMFVKRDVVTMYKQTILGPLWFFIQPIMTTLVYMVVFGGIAGIPTDGVPRILFYSSGIVLWNYFSDLFTFTSKTFSENSGLFGKVYFPRILVPVSKLISGFLKFGVQFLFFLAVFIYHILTGTIIHPNKFILFTPILIGLVALLGLGSGIIFSSLTNKYRDLVFLLQFGMQLLMYATPVIYPLSRIPEKYRIYILLNPVTHVIEAFRFAFLGTGSWSWIGLSYSCGVALALVTFGSMIFNRVERTFMDTV